MGDQSNIFVEGFSIVYSMHRGEEETEVEECCWCYSLFQAILWYIHIFFFWVSTLLYVMVDVA